MADYLSPGVYTKVQDESLYVAAQSTTVTGMVGVASRGPLNEAVFVTSWPQFVERFGSFRSDSWLAYAAKQFFDHGGEQLYVSRVAPSDAASATATVEWDGTPVLEFTMEPGAYSNGWTVETVKGDDDEFSVVLKDDNGTVLETFDFLVAGTANISSPDHVENRINGRSWYGLSVEELADETPETASPVAFSGGADGNVSSLSDSDFLGDASDRSGLHAFDNVQPLNLVAIPGVATQAVITGVVAYCAARGDTHGIVGTPQNITTPSLAETFRMDGNWNDRHASLYWPWVKIHDPLTNRTIDAPVEGLVLGVYAFNDRNGNPWDAPAGLNRGVLRNVLGVTYPTSTAERDLLYPKAINVIAQFPGEGTVVWGQRTLTSKPSAFDRVNVQRLVNYMRAGLAETSRWLLFEPNDERTWAAFHRFAGPVLANIQSRRGFYDSDGLPGYRIICDATTNTPFYQERNTMVAKIFFRPQKTAEFIELVFTATNQGVDLNLA